MWGLLGLRAMLSQRARAQRGFQGTGAWAQEQVGLRGRVQWGREMKEAQGVRAGGRAWWRPRMWEMGAEGGSSRGQQWARGTDGSLQATGQRPRSRSREGEEEEQEGQAETRGRAGRAGRSRTGDEKRRTLAATPTSRQGDTTVSTGVGPGEQEGEEEL
jgi:hypothetical protein